MTRGILLATLIILAVAASHIHRVAGADEPAVRNHGMHTLIANGAWHLSRAWLCCSHVAALPPLVVTDAYEEAKGLLKPPMSMLL